MKEHPVVQYQRHCVTQRKPPKILMWFSSLVPRGVIQILALLGCYDWCLVKDVSEQSIGSVFECRVWILKTGMKGCLEKSVTNYKYKLRSIPEEGRCQYAVFYVLSLGGDIKNWNCRNINREISDWNIYLVIIKTYIITNIHIITNKHIINNAHIIINTKIITNIHI